MTWDDPITTVKGVGESVAKKLAVLGVHTIGDLINNYPRRYNDFSQLSSIRGLRPGPVTIQAVITQVKGRYVRRGMHITEAIASDETDSVRLVWFNQPYREGAVKYGQSYFISGTYELSRTRFAILNPSMELVSDFPVNTARIVPVYRETKGLTSNQIRRFIRETIPFIRRLAETLPAWLVKQERLMAYAEALEAMHFPKSSANLEAAQRRLGFEEVFELSLASLLNKYELLQDTSVSIPFNEKLARQFVGHLPFTLTDAQRKVVWRIYQDMQKPQPMNRLVEGDVGSGKTVVAAMAALMVMSEGYQTAVMAPTELLARQHAETIRSLLEPLGMHNKIALLVGGIPTKQKKDIYDHIANGDAQCIIGTHALIQEEVDMHKLGLVIIDEQHRFGVKQRKKLMSKAGHMPHLLSLSATPIPRSLALTLYGELDISIISSKPAGRKPITTEICSPNSRAQLNARIEEELEKGRQMFVVCPLISSQKGQSRVDESEDNGSKPSISSAEKVFDRLSKRDFKHRRVGLLHGKMKAAEKQMIMEQFASHQLDILVSTTVIEVGVDVPNASIMLIEAADRFGLAQIHQLRGRVGRGGHHGYCFLMMSDSSAPPQRLQVLERSNDGFKLAELDLKLRGPGAIYGTTQHGQLDLRVATLTDVHLITQARAAAQTYIDRAESLVQYPVTLEHVTRLRAVTNLN
ncbi:MAG TPA: ATP-dependent DNA helicase RecG [Candidatus Saccharimonadales bacterium]|nr:ATP-dependent DNA helicase RecG [Candidatus Saccharimonadales bacterium]